MLRLCFIDHRNLLIFRLKAFDDEYHYITKKEIDMYIKQILTVASISVLLGACGGGSGGGSGTGTDALADVDAGTDTDTGTDVDTGADADAGADTDAGTDTETGTDADTGADAGTDGINQFGVLTIDQFVFGQVDNIEISIGGSFLILNDNADVDLDFDRQFEELIDTCEVDGDDGDFDLDPVSNTISAGETITVTSATGTFATLVEMVIPDIGSVYVSQNELAAPLPQNLIIDIPGGDFPAFTNVSVPNVPPLDISPGSDDIITADTEFQWTPSSEAFSGITIEATFTTGNAGVDIICVARDDGSFSFPANIRDMIGSAEASFVTLERSAFNVVDSGDSRLLILNEFEL